MDEDMEADSPRSGVSLVRASDNARYLCAAGIFALYSYLVMNEGAIRTALEPNPNFSRSLLRAATSGEMVFGVVGLVLGLAIVLFRAGSATATKCWQFIAVPLGWFVFTIYVLAIPINSLVNQREVPAPLMDLSLSQYDVLRVMGLFGGMTWCFALQGGQYMVGNVILCHQTTGGKGSTFARLRMIVWSVNIAVSGIVFLVAGSVALGVYGGGAVSVPLNFPPIFITYPEMAVAAGLVQLLFGIMGVVVAVMASMFEVLGIFGAFSFLLSLSTIVWSQALVKGIVPATSMLAGLCLMLHSNVLYAGSELQRDLR